MKKIKTALISVSNKKNLKPLLNSLKKNNIKIISSGGTYKEIKKLNRVQFQDWTISDCKCEIYVNNCVYSQLERSGNQSLNISKTNK